jgi:hypothetical protein
MVGIDFFSMSAVKTTIMLAKDCVLAFSEKTRGELMLGGAACLRMLTLDPPPSTGNGCVSGKCDSAYPVNQARVDFDQRQFWDMTAAFFRVRPAQLFLSSACPEHAGARNLMSYGLCI